MKKHKGKRTKVREHDRAPRGSLPPKRPMPGANEFSPGQEQAMRAGSERRMAPPSAAGPPMGLPPDEDMGGLM